MESRTLSDEQSLEDERLRLMTIKLRQQALLDQYKYNLLRQRQLREFDPSWRRECEQRKNRVKNIGQELGFMIQGSYQPDFLFTRYPNTTSLDHQAGIEKYNNATSYYRVITN